MGLFHHKKHDEAAGLAAADSSGLGQGTDPGDPGAGDPLTGGSDGAFEVVDADGNARRYVPDDFDEIWTTTDEEEMRHHVRIGWLLLDEALHVEDGPDREVFVSQAVYTGGSGSGLSGAAFSGVGGMGMSERTVPMRVETEETLTTYILGYLKDGHAGSPVA